MYVYNINSCSIVVFKFVSLSFIWFSQSSHRSETDDILYHVLSHTHTHTDIYIYIYIHIYIYIYIYIVVSHVYLPNPSIIF